MTTPIERIEHIRQCLRNMKPTMGYEMAAVAVIEENLAELESIFSRLGQMVELVTCPACGREYQTSGCCECPPRAER